MPTSQGCHECSRKEYIQNTDTSLLLLLLLFLLWWLLLLFNWHYYYSRKGQLKRFPEAS